MCIGWLRLRKYSYIYRVIYLIVIKMLKVVAFMKQVAKGLQMEGCLLYTSPSPRDTR